MLKRLLEGRPLGHPLHPLITHLPLGLWLLSLGLDVAAYFRQENWMVVGSFAAMLAGTITALLAAITGFNDWLDIRDDHPAQSTAMWHMGLNLAATFAYIANTILRWGELSYDQPSAIALTLSFLGYATVIVSGYLGGLLIYDEGISVGRHRRRADLPQETLKEALADSTEQPQPHADSLSDDFVPIAPMDGITHCHTLRVEVRGYVLCIARCGEKVFAFQEFCTHRCGPLSEGHIEDDSIECPWHRSVFDMKTGAPIDGPAKVPLRIFEVRVANNMIHVRIPHDRESPPDRPPERRNPAETPNYQRADERLESPQRWKAKQ